VGSIDKNSGKSFTQLEYEKASKLNKEVLVYLADEKNTLVKVGFIDRGKDRELLEAFKGILKEERTVATFISKDDLCEKVKRDLERVLNYKESEKHVEGDEFGRSERILEAALLSPISFSGDELRLQIHVEGHPYPASREICEAFNLRFGATIGLKIKIVKPEGFENVGIDELYMAPNHWWEGLLPSIENEQAEIYAKVQFTDSKITSSEASYKPVEYSIMSGALDESMFGYKTLEADGKIVLFLTDVKNKSAPG
jgi:hypothetical protein